MSTISYTMRPKTQDVIKKNLTCWKNPGPDTYQSIDLEPKAGRFIVSKYSDTKFAKINPKTERFSKIKQSPGPSNYHHKDGLNGLGKYIVSKHKSDGTRAFAQTTRFGSRGLWTLT